MNTKKLKGAIGIDDLSPIAVGMVGLVIVVAVSAVILTQFAGMSIVTADNNTTYIVGAGQNAVSLFADWFSILIIVVLSIVVIALVMLLQRNRGGA